MALKDPLAEFNRQNPFVIKAKRMYNELMGKYESLSKTFLIASGIHIILAVLVTIGAVVTAPRLLSICFGIPILLISNLLLYRIFTKRVHDPDHEKLDKMVSIQLNEIIEVNVEYVYEVVNIVYRMIGRVEGTMDSIRAITLITSIATILVSAITIYHVYF